MSTSPLKSGINRLSDASAQGGDDRLTLSQALIITAGMAGLVGLSSGVIVRFLLADSPDARFLSPLQTFPALSDWSSELPQGTADSAYVPGDAVPADQVILEQSVYTEDQISTIDSINPANSKEQLASDPGDDTFDSTSFLDTEATQDIAPVDTATFDTFAGRGRSDRPVDPLKALETGPKLGIQNSQQPIKSSTTIKDGNYEEDYPTVEGSVPGDGTYSQDDDGEW
ncbi:MAG: hypothetical protein WA885_09565 [Phormidesmis sp.]